MSAAPARDKSVPAAIAGELVTLYRETNRPDEVAKWQAERAKHDSPAPKPQEKK